MEILLKKLLPKELQDPDGFISEFFEIVNKPGLPSLSTGGNDKPLCHSTAPGWKT